MSQVAQIWPYFLKLFSVSGCWTLQRKQCSTQPLQMEIRPVQPQHPMLAPSDLRGTLSFQSPCTDDLGCTAQSFSCFLFKNWKDLMFQTCSLIVLSTFTSTKMASVQFMLWPTTTAPLPQKQIGKEHSRFTRNLLNDGSALSVLLIPV